MKARIALAVFGTLTLAHAAELSVGAPTATPAPVAPVTVEMISATLADDCGGGRPHVPTKMKMKSEKSDAAESRSNVKGKRRCEQTSMQLSVVATAAAEPTDLRVKKVEMLDERGAVVSELTARTPTAWNGAGVYAAWDQRVQPSSSLSVSYALSQPDWNEIDDRWNRTFTLRAVVTVSGRDQTLQRDVTVTAPTSLPPNVKT